MLHNSILALADFVIVPFDHGNNILISFLIIFLDYTIVNETNNFINEPRDIQMW